MEKSKRQSGSKVAELKEKLQASRSEIRSLRYRLSAVEKSRDHQQGKVRVLRKENKQIRRSASSSKVGASPILRHRYDTRIVSLCIALYAFAGCSFRGVKRVLMCLQMELGLSAADIPGKSSVDNWVQKAGLYQLSTLTTVPEQWGSYCLIMDESMVVGKERMMLALGAPAQKTGSNALSFESVKVLGIGVLPSWKHGDVQDFIQKVQEKMGQKAAYVVSDGGASLKKGIHESGLIRICDVGHEMCKLMEQTYKNDPRYEVWIKAVTKVRFQVFMKDTAYLLPPKQRTVARFTNLSHVVRWAVAILRAMPGLSKDEQQTYGWLDEHKEVIGVFERAFHLSESILKILKNDGLSHQNIEKGLLICQKQAPVVCKKLLDKVVAFLRDEKEKLPKVDTVWHMSSDVIESLFGKFKHLAASNPLNGVTARVLSLCLFTSGNGSPENVNNYAQQALESISLSKLASWKNDYLIDNQIVRRRKTFKK